MRVMRGWFKSPLRVRGYRVPSRRFTVWALYYCLVYFVLPVLAIGLAWTCSAICCLSNFWAPVAMGSYVSGSEGSPAGKSMPASF